MSKPSESERSDQFEQDAELLIRHGLVEKNNRARTVALLRTRERLRSISFAPERNELRAAWEQMNWAVNTVAQELSRCEDLLSELEPLKSDRLCADQFQELRQTLKAGTDSCTMLRDLVDLGRVCDAIERVFNSRINWAKALQKLQHTVADPSAEQENS